MSLDAENALVTSSDERCDYLFQTPSGTVEFVEIAEDMEQLHEFCVLCQDSLSRTVETLKQDLVSYREHRKRVVVEYIGDVTEDAIMGLEDFEIPTWEDSQRFLMPAMCLIMVSAFVEKSLKTLCSKFAPPGQAVGREKRVGGIILGLISFLKEQCGFRFTEPAESSAARNECRQIRNSFAHGDWPAVKSVVARISLKEAFRSASQLFAVIEEGKPILPSPQ